MENNVREESGLKFQFPENDTVIKFDDTKFYRDYFNKLPKAKGVDFISVDKNEQSSSSLLEWNRQHRNDGTESSRGSKRGRRRSFCSDFRRFLR